MQNIQVVRIGVDPKKLRGENELAYYNQLRSNIRKKILNEADILIIQMIPKEDITEVWIVELLLDLQGEFTKLLVIPRTPLTLDEKKLDELKRHLKADVIFRGV